MNKISKGLTIGLFFSLLIVVAIITIISPKEDFSEVENRTLESYPECSVDDIKSRDYMKSIENYLSDHFIGRNNWIEAKTDIELLTGKKEINGVYVLKNRFVEKLENPDYVEVQKSIDVINNFAKEIEIPVYVMVAPTASGIYIEDLPQNAPKFGQKAFIDFIYESFNSDEVVTLDAYSALFPTRDEYIYYRNDHHWTTLGAYYAYASTIKKMGFEPILFNNYDIEHVSSDFKGSLYSKALYDGIKADTLDFYHYSNGINIESVIVETGANAYSYDSMYFRDFINKKDKYSAFLGQNQPVVTINTDSQNDNSLLVIKDSYAHCYIPFLSQHYSKITMIDLRYINSGFEDVMNFNNYDQVMFLYNASSFAKDKNIKKLNYFM